MSTKEEIDGELVEKLRRLETAIRSSGKLLVAFSGGVDSAVIAAVAHRVLGPDALAATIVSELMPESERECARRVAQEIGIRHELIEHSGLMNEQVIVNPPDRCYYCKREDTQVLRALAEHLGIERIAFGVTVSDFSEHRPGIQATREEGAWLPLVEAGLTKREVRTLAREFNLSVHDKPPQACLASRIPYGEKITGQKLEAIAKSEALLLAHGLRQVRVRHHGTIARIEVEHSEMAKLIQEPLRTEIVEKLKALGFTYVTIDLMGYRSGSMDEVIE